MRAGAVLGRQRRVECLAAVACQETVLGWGTECETRVDGRPCWEETDVGTRHLHDFMRYLRCMITVTSLEETERYRSTSCRLLVQHDIKHARLAEKEEEIEKSLTCYQREVCMCGVRHLPCVPLYSATAPPACNAASRRLLLPLSFSLIDRSSVAILASNPLPARRSYRSTNRVAIPQS